jgi:transmembrane sensor
MEDKHINKEAATKYWLHYFRRNDVPELTAAELNRESQHIYHNLMGAHERPQLKINRSNSYWISAAAAVLLISGISILYLKSSETSIKQHQVHHTNSEGKPGRTAATLILSGGERVVLSTAANGKIADQTGVEIFKTAQNGLVYKATNYGSKSVQQNTVLTTAGEQYSVNLPDGTKVWLNAASSLRFPTSFLSPAERTVELTGEAYFEVAKDSAHPFIVKTDKQVISVLGTHFNVNSYAEEGLTKTTLLEGSVKIVPNNNTHLTTILKPGQQAQLSSDILKVEKVDLSESMAWKNGDFNFENEEFRSVLNQISRWYNVDITDNGNHAGLKLSGMVSRSKSLSTVLQALESTANVKFKVDGRKVTVIE